MPAVSSLLDVLARGWFTTAEPLNEMCHDRTLRSDKVPVLTGKLQDLAHLIRTLDGPRVARDPGGSHGQDGDALEVVTPDLHGAKAPRHSEAAYQAVEHIACVAAGLRHSGRDQRLTMPFAGLFQRMTAGSMMQEVCPCGTPNSAPST